MGWDGMGWNALGWDGMRWERDVQSYLTHLFSEILVFERNTYTHTHTHTHIKKKERKRNRFCSKMYFSVQIKLTQI